VLPGPKLATGGQGEIFAVSSPSGFVLKRYLRRTLDSDPALARRLRVMAARRPAEWREAGSGHMNPFAPFFEDLAAFARSPQASGDAVRAFLAGLDDQSGGDKTLLAAVRD